MVVLVVVVQGLGVCMAGDWRACWYQDLQFLVSVRLSRTLQCGMGCVLLTGADELVVSIRGPTCNMCPGAFAVLVFTWLLVVRFCQPAFCEGVETTAVMTPWPLDSCPRH
jgi:hypothetical protein